MSPLDEQFRKRLERIFLDWQKGVATLLRKGSPKERFAATLIQTRLPAF